MSETVLEEASRLVSTDRGTSYGHPADDFGRAAKIWSAILGVEVTAVQVGLCQIGTKLAREVNSRKRDNLTDIAGYARCVEMVYERAEGVHAEARSAIREASSRIEHWQSSGNRIGETV